MTAGPEYVTRAEWAAELAEDRLRHQLDYRAALQRLADAEELANLRAATADRVWAELNARDARRADQLRRHGIELDYLVDIHTAERHQHPSA